MYQSSSASLKHPAHKLNEKDNHLAIIVQKPVSQPLTHQPNNKGNGY